LTVAVGLVAALTAAAQTITGTVYDPTGALVSGARVMLMEDYVKLQETKSGERGEFSFAGLKPGLYYVQIKQPVFSLFQQHVEVKDGQPAHIHAILPLARSSDVLSIRGPVAPAGVKRGATGIRAQRAGGKVQPPRLQKMVPPAYPAGAEKRGAEGPVVIDAAIKIDGTLGEPMVLEAPDAALEAAALEAIRQWRYQPMRLNGQPVECRSTVVFDFRLQ
jgi:TonB family protein